MEAWNGEGLDAEIGGAASDCEALLLCGSMPDHGTVETGGSPALL